VRRKRVKPEGKNSQLVLTLQPPGTEAVPAPGVSQLTASTPRNAPINTPRPTDAAPGTAPTRQATPEEMETATELFNQKSKKGIEFLLTNHILSGDPKQTVEYLLTAKGISRHAIGDYLGTRGEPERVLEAFTESMDFKGKPFDECIRTFFCEFFPPGEAAIIYRMMSAFGNRYVECNSGMFHGEDVACVLAYATLMLNTDLHSKSIKNKMTKDQFCRNLRGADEGHDINRAFLEELFDRVAAQEIQMLDDDVPYRGGRPAGTKWRSEIIKVLGQGAQFMKYGRRGSPHQRWVWVSGDLQYVCYGKSHGSATQDSMFAVKQIKSVTKGMQSPVFMRAVPDDNERVKIEGRCLSLDATQNGEGRTLDLEASSEAERKKWVEAFRFLVSGYLTD